MSATPQMVRAFFHADGKGMATHTLNGADGYGALMELLKGRSVVASTPATLGGSVPKPAGP